MTDPNSYLRRDDVTALLRSRMTEIQSDVDQMIREMSGTGGNEVGPLRKQYLGGQIALGLAEIEAVRRLVGDLGRLKGFTYRSFLDYDGATTYNSLVATDADRVPLDPEPKGAVDAG